MKVAIVHTRYRERGGEDAVVDAETALLREHGHEVVQLLFHNERFAERSRLHTARATIWNEEAARAVRQMLARERPDVVHVHNTFPGASPAVFWEARKYPLVHTLHNYRWACVNSYFLRDGRPCEDCLGTHPWRGALYACYQGNRPASAVAASMLAYHRERDTLGHVDRFIAVTAFAREKMAQAGLPREKIIVKPNFTSSGPPRPAAPDEEPFVLYVGRLSPEKGIEVLAEAWRRDPDLPPLEVVGEGPARPMLEGTPNVRLLGALAPERVRDRMASARLLVVPSLWYETFGLVAIEAYAVGLPVIASNIGALSEVVEEGRTGWLVPPRDVAALIRAVREGMADPAWERRSGEARRLHRERYTPEANLSKLIGAYEAAGAGGSAG